LSSSSFALIGALDSLDETAAWFADVSAARADVTAAPLGPLPKLDFTPYSSRGGMGSWPTNSQQLAVDVVTPFAEAGEIHESCVVIGVPPGSGVSPHVWRFRSGGLRIGARRWLRRYAVVPENATVGVLAHEVGHLLFGWPDVAARTGVRDDCLMAMGGHREPPSRPCAPLRVAAGWVEPITASRTTTVDDLGTGVMAVGETLVERSRSGAVLVFAHRPDVELIGRAEAGCDRRLLAVVAEIRARHRAAHRRKQPSVNQFGPVGR